VYYTDKIYTWVINNRAVFVDWFIVIVPCLASLPFFAATRWSFLDHSIYYMVGREVWNGGTFLVDAWDQHTPLMYIIVGGLSFVFGSSMVPFYIFMAVIYFITYGIMRQLIHELDITHLMTRATIVYSFLCFFLLYFQWNTEQLYAPILAYFAQIILKEWKKGPDNFIESKFGFKVALLMSIAIFLKPQAWIEVTGLMGITTLIVFNNDLTKGFWHVVRVSFFGLIPFVIWLTFYGRGLSHNYKSLFGYNFNYLTSGSQTSSGTSYIELAIHVLLLAIGVFYIYSHLIKGKKSQRNLYWVGLWAMISVFGSTITGRFYPHYIAQSMVPIVLVLVLILKKDVINTFKLWLPIRLTALLTILVFFGYQSILFVNNFGYVVGDKVPGVFNSINRIYFNQNSNPENMPSCTIFKSPFYCSNSVNEIKQLVQPGSKLLNLVTLEDGFGDPGVHIETNTREAGPYYFDAHALSGIVQPWQSYLPSADYILLDTKSARYYKAKEYSDKYCKIIWKNTDRLSLSSCKN
jgi:hypothetical protein